MNSSCYTRTARAAEMVAIVGALCKRQTVSPTKKRRPEGSEYLAEKILDPSATSLIMSGFMVDQRHCAVGEGIQYASAQKGR